MRFVEKGPEELSPYTESKAKPESLCQPTVMFDSASPNLLKTMFQIHPIEIVWLTA